MSYELYQILDVKSPDVIYPFCSICYKKVFYLSNKRKWSCSCCNEEYVKVDYRYKICLEISNLSEIKVITMFGKKLESIFGIDATSFNKFRQKLFSNSSNQKWLTSVYDALNFCLIGRWLEFDLSRTSLVANSIKIDHVEAEYFITIYHFLRNRFSDMTKLEFSDDSYSSSSEIIDSTLHDINTEDEDDLLLSQALSQLELTYQNKYNSSYGPVNSFLQN